MTPRPLALSLGDPAGIGPEIIVKAWHALRADRPGLRRRRRLPGPGRGLAVRRVDPAPGRLAATRRRGPSPTPCRCSTCPLHVARGRRPAVDRARAAASSAGSRPASGLALSGAVSGLVTAPIAKAPLYEAGFAFPGHTEFLAELTAAAPYDGARGPVMMLTARRPARRAGHHPRAARRGRRPRSASRRSSAPAWSPPQALTPRLRHRRARGWRWPALNPHAGEGGAIGREEIEIIGPAVRAPARPGGVDGHRAPARRHPVPRRGARDATTRRSACTTTRP